MSAVAHSPHQLTGVSAIREMAAKRRRAAAELYIVATNLRQAARFESDPRVAKMIERVAEVKERDAAHENRAADMLIAAAEEAS